MGLTRATRNLARTARANPMWALLGVLLAPFRFSRHIIGMGLFALALFLELFVLLLLSIWMFELDKNGVVAQLALIGIIAAVVLVTAWMFVLPCFSDSIMKIAPTRTARLGPLRQRR